MAGASEENPWHTLNTEVQVLKTTQHHHSELLKNQSKAIDKIFELIDAVDNKLDSVVTAVSEGHIQYQRILEAHVAQEAQEFGAMEAARLRRENEQILKREQRERLDRRWFISTVITIIGLLATLYIEVQL